MKRLISCLLLVASAAIAAETVPKPKLVVVIVADQFRYDYLTRFRDEYRSGLERLLKSGAVFTNAYHEHFPTVTAIGHSVILTGAFPCVSGIIGNDWYDRETGKQVTSVSDPRANPVGGSGAAGASPHRLLVNTVGDEMKLATSGKARVVGMSIKDRAAILPAGHLADAAYWYDPGTGSFVTSSYYRADLPDWVKEFNSKAANQYKGMEWLGRKMPEDEKVYSALLSSPFGNDLLEAFAEQAIRNEKLGRGPAMDLVSISFSSNDYVGHQFGPESPQVRDICIQTDQVIGRLFQFLDTQLGMQNVLVIFTGDHGVAPMPDGQPGRKVLGGRMPARIIQSAVQTELTKRYGEGNWILSPSEHSLYLNRDLIQKKNLSLAEAEQAARETVSGIPHVFRAYTGEQLTNKASWQDLVGRRVLNGHNLSRGADVYILLDPYWMFGATGTTHGTAFNYDAHVPVVFMGAGVRPGRYDQNIATVDIAPTLAALLEVDPPSGSAGRVLTEAFAPK
jgi:Type I phosphodiesterase / nucleotide pyrophosphatase